MKFQLIPIKLCTSWFSWIKLIKRSSTVLGCFHQIIISLPKWGSNFNHLFLSFAQVYHSNISYLFCFVYFSTSLLNTMINNYFWIISFVFTKNIYVFLSFFSYLFQIFYPYWFLLLSNYFFSMQLQSIPMTYI